MFPLYQVTSKKEVYYAYNDEEFASLPKGDVFRMKGLGEAEAKIFTDTIFSKDQSRMVQFTMNDAVDAEYYFNMLMGNNIEDRKEYIMNTINWEE